MEIYNFKKLKQELIKKGHLFTSNGDTEILISFVRMGPYHVKK